MLQPDTCPTCGAPRNDLYCGACGERRLEPGAFTLRHFLAQGLSVVTNADGRLWSTLRALLGRPGALTASARAGSRVRHLGPLQRFLLANLIALVAGSWLGVSALAESSGRLAPRVFTTWAESVRGALGLDPATFATVLGGEAERLAGWLYFTLIPLQACIGVALHRRSPAPLGIHLTLACSFLAFYLLVPETLLSALHEALVQGLGRRGLPSAYTVGTHTRWLVPTLASAWWLAGAERRVFGARRAVAVGRGLAGAVLFAFGALPVYRWTLALATLVSLDPR